jgi:MATE family multidrug resistance protein
LIGSKAYQQELHKIARLSGPIIVAQIAQVGMGFTDTLMAGHLGALDLGAIAVGVNMWILPYLFCVGLMMAVSATVANHMGAGEFSSIKSLMRQLILLVVILAILAVLTVRNAPALLYWAKIDSEIIPVATQYAHAVAWGFPGVIAYLALRFLSEGIGFTRPMMVIQLSGLVINALGNYLLMFGKLGFPAMGAVGAGWSTAFVMWFDLLLIAVYAAKHPRYKVVWQAENIVKQWSKLVHVTRLGVPIALTIVAEVGMFTVVAMLMGRIGIAEVAAHQVALNFAAMAFMVPFGIASAITVRVGNAKGEGDYQKARFRARVGIELAAVLALFSASIMLLFPEHIVGMYTSDINVTGIATSLLAVAAIFQLSDSVQVAAFGALRGMKDTLSPLLITLFCYWVIGMPVSYYFGFTRTFGPQGLWFGLVVGLTLAAVLLLWRFFSLNSRLTKNLGQK